MTMIAIIHNRSPLVANTNTSLSITQFADDPPTRRPQRTTTMVSLLLFRSSSVRVVCPHANGIVQRSIGGDG